MSIPSFDPNAALLRDERLTDGLLTRRVIAWLIDLMIIGVLVKLCWVVLGVFSVIALLVTISIGIVLPLFSLLAIIPVLYGWLSLVSPLQSSPGQAVMGMIVVRDADLGAPTGLQAFVYMVGYLVTMAFGAIWTAVAVVTTRHRTLHDIVSGLVVVRRSALQSPLTPGTMGLNMGPGGARTNYAPNGGGRPFA